MKEADCLVGFNVLKKSVTYRAGVGPRSWLPRGTEYINTSQKPATQISKSLRLTRGEGKSKQEELGGIRKLSAPTLKMIVVGCLLVRDLILVVDVGGDYQVRQGHLEGGVVDGNLGMGRGWEIGKLTVG